jgi:catechol 2,3-dioxygenase-like lactoylglutathione lyase family enzyme
MKILCALALGMLSNILAHAQQAPTPPAATGPAPTGLIIGSGNYFSPIVANLDATVAFYRDGLGLDVQGAPGDANANLPLRNMFGLPEATLRWQIARSPAAPGGVEIIEVTNAGGKPITRAFEDVGSATLVATVRDVDATLARLKQLGATVVTKDAPVAVQQPVKARVAVVRDPAGHFVELIEPEVLPETTAPPTANVVAVRVLLTVADVAQALRLYGDALGMKVVNARTTPGGQAAWSALFGAAAAPSASAVVQIPTSGIAIELVEFAGANRVAGRIQDAGSTRMQIRVNDIDEAIAAFKRFGGEVVSTGGVPLDLPAGNGVLKVAIVRDANNLFVVLIQAPPPAA